MSKKTSSFGSSLRDARERAGLTQGQLAALAAVHRQRISALETGRRNPTLGTLRELADVLKISIAELIGEKATL